MPQSYNSDRRRLIGAAVIGSALTLTGCDKKAPAAAAPEAKGGDLLARILAKGEIVIATEGTWAPWCYHDAKGNLTGFDVEVARLVAQKLGVRAVFNEGKWDGLLAGLDAGRSDIMFNGVDRTPERERAYRFSEPYVYNRTVVITHKDNGNIRRLEDLKGRKTANTISSTYAALAEAQGARVVGVDDLQQTFELLINNRIDATVNAEAAFYDFIKVHPDAPIKIAVRENDVTAVAAPMNKRDDTATLAQAVNKALAELRAAGELKRLSVQFLGGDLTAPN